MDFLTFERIAAVGDEFGGANALPEDRGSRNVEMNLDTAS
jgi:hypothetical protein